MANVPRSIEEELQNAYVQSEKNKGKKKKKSQDLILLESIKKGGSINKGDDDTTLLANLYDPDGDVKSMKSNKQKQRRQTASSENPAFVDSENDISPKKSVKQKKKTDLIIRQDSNPATIETVNEVLSSKPKQKKKTVVELKNESNSNKAAEVRRTSNVSSEPGDEPPPQPRAKKKIKKSEASKTRAETQSNELNDEEKEVAVTEPPKGLKPKPRKSKKKPVVNDDEAVEDAQAEATNGNQLRAEDDKVLQIVVHRTDKLKSDVYVMHPVVRISVVDLETGCAIKKQPSDRRVSAFFGAANENVDFILPIITLPFDLKKNQSLMPIWEETVVFSESFDHLCQTETNVMIFFEVLDFVSMRTTNRRINNNQQDGGWYHVAWAFLKLVGANGHLNTGKKVRLQLYKPLRRASPSTGDQLQVFTWWKNHLQRVPYPSTLYVTVKPMVVPLAQPDSEQPSLVRVRRDGEDHVDGNAALDLAEGASGGGAEMSLWSRFPGQQCRIPNSPFLNLSARRKGCYSLRFSHNGKSLACGCHDRDGYPILIYSIPSGNLIGEFLGHYGIVYDLSWSKSDRGLLSASGDGTARVWNVDKMESAACKFLPHPSFVYAAKYHPRVGRVVVTSGFDKVIRVWSLLSDGSHGVLMQEIDGHDGNVNALCFDEEGSKLFSGDGLGYLCVWNVFVSDEPTSTGIAKNWSLEKKIVHKDVVGNAINVLQLHPNGRRLLVHTRNNKLLMVDLRVESVITKFIGALNFREHVRSVITPCGSFVFAGSEDGQAYVWNTESGDLVSTYSNLGYDSTVIDVNFHPHDHIVAFCTYGTSQHVKVFKYDAQIAKREVLGPIRGSLRKDASVELPLSQTFSTQVFLCKEVKYFSKQIQGDTNISCNRLEKTAISTATELNVSHALRLQRAVSKLNSVTAMQKLLNSQGDASNTPRSEWLPSAVGDHANLLMSYPGLQPQISITRTSTKAQLTFKDSFRATNKPFEEVIVLYEYHAQRSDELDLQQGERIKVLYKDTEHWWMGELQNGRQGFFPSNYVAEPEVTSKSATAEKPPSGSRTHAVKTKSGELKFVSDNEES